MDTENLGQSCLVNKLAWLGGLAMESRLRHALFNGERILQNTGVRLGQTVLEVGSGTGFFTLTAARLIGTEGQLIAMDPMAGFCDRVRKKVQDAGLANVEVIRRDALQTRLADDSVDLVLLLGVLPHPSLPLRRLLPEMHRILKPDGKMGLWLFPLVGNIPRAIARSGLFAPVSNWKRCFLFEPVIRQESGART